MNSIATMPALLHPLDPPTAEEINVAGGLVQADLEGAAVFSSVALIEPDKDQVKAREANPGDVLPRCLRVTGFDTVRGQSFAADVDVREARLQGVTYLGDAQSAINEVDVHLVTKIVKEHDGWQTAMRARGVQEFELVQIDPWPTGGFIDESLPRGHRGFRAITFVREDETDNGYARPVQGLIAHVDLTVGEVTRLEDHGVVPLPPGSGRYDAQSQPELRDPPLPLEITQPDGVSFTVDGYSVAWQKWQFRVSMHPIHGLVLHQLSYGDAGRQRSILYRASLSDMVVPYGDPDPMHGWKHVFDASEASIGALSGSLTLGCDCLGEIRYLDINVIGSNGEARRIENAICLHEEDYGILWKHYDARGGTDEVRRSRRLVISAIHTVGNYEYGFFWYLYLDGTIQMEVKLTGIVGVSAVADGAERPEFAPLIAPNLASPVHQHLFSFRLDFDLDDAPMSVYEVNAEPLAPDDPENPYGTAFRAATTRLDSEQTARRDANPQSSRTWKVVSTTSRNRMGIPVAYKLLPGATPVLLAGEDSPVARRAGFARHNLWVTPYQPDELSAAGDYTNLHPGDGGLPSWTARDRSLVDTDIVLWHTVGLTHVPRPEDWPVMPVEYCGFHLQPVGFFERNPALDLPSPETVCDCAPGECTHHHGGHDAHNGH